MAKNTSREGIIGMLTVLKSFYDESMGLENLFSVNAETMRKAMPGDDRAESVYYALYNDVAERSEMIVEYLNMAQNALLELNNRFFSPLSAEPFQLCFEKKNDAPKTNNERLLTGSAAQAWKKLSGELPAVMARLLVLGDTLLQYYSTYKDLLGEETNAVKTLRACCLYIAQILKEEKEKVLVHVQNCEDAEKEVMELISDSENPQQA